MFQNMKRKMNGMIFIIICCCDESLPGVIFCWKYVVAVISTGRMLMLNPAIVATVSGIERSVIQKMNGACHRSIELMRAL